MRDDLLYFAVYICILVFAYYTFRGESEEKQRLMDTYFLTWCFYFWGVFYMGEISPRYIRSRRLIFYIRRKEMKKYIPLGLTVLRI